MNIVYFCQKKKNDVKSKLEIRNWHSDIYW